MAVVSVSRFMARNYGVSSLLLGHRLGSARTGWANAGFPTYQARTVVGAAPDDWTVAFGGIEPAWARSLGANCSQGESRPEAEADAAARDHRQAEDEAELELEKLLDSKQFGLESQDLVVPSNEQLLKHSESCSPELVHSVSSADFPSLMRLLLSCAPVEKCDTFVCSAIVERVNALAPGLTLEQIGRFAAALSRQAFAVDVTRLGFVWQQGVSQLVGAPTSTVTKLLVSLERLGVRDKPLLRAFTIQIAARSYLLTPADIRRILTCSRLLPLLQPAAIFESLRIRSCQIMGRFDPVDTVDTLAGVSKHPKLFGMQAISFAGALISQANRTLVAFEPRHLVRLLLCYRRLRLSHATCLTVLEDAIHSAREALSSQEIVAALGACVSLQAFDRSGLVATRLAERLQKAIRALDARTLALGCEALVALAGRHVVIKQLLPKALSAVSTQVAALTPRVSPRTLSRLLQAMALGSLRSGAIVSYCSAHVEQFGLEEYSAGQLARILRTFSQLDKYDAGVLKATLHSVLHPAPNSSHEHIGAAAAALLESLAQWNFNDPKVINDVCAQLQNRLEHLRASDLMSVAKSLGYLAADKAVASPSHRRALLQRLQHQVGRPLLSSAKLKDLSTLGRTSTSTRLLIPSQWNRKHRQTQRSFRTYKKAQRQQTDRSSRSNRPQLPVYTERAASLQASTLRRSCSFTARFRTGVGRQTGREPSSVSN